MEINELQELLLAFILPQWQYWIIKPLKRRLKEGVSLGMYYCLQILQRHEGKMMTMSELARHTRMTKQQMTNTISCLVECGLVERVQDPADRRIVRLKTTEKADAYIHRFLTQDTAYLKELLASVSEADRAELKEALKTLCRIFQTLKCTRDPLEKEEI